MFRAKFMFLLVVTGLALASPPTSFGQESPSTHSGHQSWFSGDDVIVVIPHARKRISAFSVDTGTWASFELKTPLDSKSDVSVYGKLAVLETTDCIYAFSAKTAQWSKLPIPRNTDASVALYKSHIQVQMDNSLYLFSPASRKWRGRHLTTGDDSPMERSGVN